MNLYNEKNKFLSNLISFGVLLISTDSFSLNYQDPISLGMGSTGITNSSHVYAANNNPALLSSYQKNTLFGLIFPGIEVGITDNKNLYDGMYKLEHSDYLDSFQEDMDSINATVQKVKLLQKENPLSTEFELKALNDLYHRTNILSDNISLLKENIYNINGSADLLINNLEEVSKKNIDITLNLQAGFSFSNPKFSFAVNTSTINYFSNILYIDRMDLNKMKNYTESTSQYADLLKEYANSTVTLLDLFIELGIDPSLIEENSSEILDEMINVYIANRDMENFNYGGDLTEDPNDGDIAIIKNGEFIENDDIKLLSTGQSIAININEISFSIAKRFGTDKHNINFGITPKLQQIRTYDYLYSLMDTIEIGSMSEIETAKNYINFDLGLLIKDKHKYYERKIGLVIKNINHHKMLTFNNYEANFSPSIILGINYHILEFFQISSELDLIENKPVLFEDSTQYFRLGSELNIYNFLKLRAGYKVDILDMDKEYLSAGLGLSVLGLSLDVGASVLNKDIKKDSNISIGLSFSY